MAKAKSSPFTDVGDDMLSALLDWRQRRGRFWKNELLAAWMNGTDELDARGSALRTIRNRFGPTWLDRLRPRDLDAEAGRRGITALRK